jgi:phospholipid-translocating ATPase
MLHAIQEFFPESELPSTDGAANAEPLPASSDAQAQEVPLQRIDTGISSIVGENNGDRPGGFVLVIDGTALGFVSSFESRIKATCWI